ncbi:hypothetical protein LIER_06117 [Lithospermum erythrorhizon]|uniref:Uncharacterized protein n=1 Tax=Lithospermum erythrorhizon TaxID=34254 RepID=A0AAV3P4V4_LITER
MPDPPCLSFAGCHCCPSSHKARSRPRRRGRPLGGNPGVGEFPGVPSERIYEGGGSPTVLGSLRTSPIRGPHPTRGGSEGGEGRCSFGGPDEVEVERPTMHVAELQSQRLSAGPPFS